MPILYLCTYIAFEHSEACQAYIPKYVLLYLKFTSAVCIRVCTGRYTRVYSTDEKLKLGTGAGRIHVSPPEISPATPSPRDLNQPQHLSLHPGG